MTHQLPNGYTHRPATTADAERVATLWNDRSEVTQDVRSSTPEQVLKTWDHPKFDLSTDSRLVFAPDETLISYAHVRDAKDPPVDVFTGSSVHPNYDDADWLWDALFSWMEDKARRVIVRASQDVRIALVAGTPDEDTTKQRVLGRFGFEHSRVFRRMQIDFRAPPKGALHPNGIAVRTVVPGEDD